MNKFDMLDSTSLKAFYYAAKTLNFTRAAKLAGLTQSGVSQHVARLEDVLKTPLFLRQKRQLELTQVGEILKGYSENLLIDYTALLEQVDKGSCSLAGNVSYAMPASCLKTPHFNMLLEKLEDYPDIDLKVKIAHNEEILKDVLEGKIDFGFITREIPHGSLTYLPFAQEEYILVGQKEYIEQINAKNLTELPFITYPGVDVFLDLWRDKYFPKKKSFNIHGVNLKGEVNHLDGAIAMVCAGKGISLFPKHCVDEFLGKNGVTYFSKKKAPPVGGIYIIHKKGVDFSLRVRKVVELFFELKG